MEVDKISEDKIKEVKIVSSHFRSKPFVDFPGTTLTLEIHPISCHDKDLLLMSAYGVINRPLHEGNSLPTKRWNVTGYSPAQPSYVTTHHLTLVQATRSEGLLDYLSAVFAKEVDDGFTYPQEGPIDRSAFDGYFFAADVIVAITGKMEQGGNDKGDIALDIDTACGGRSWGELWERLNFTKAGLIPRAGRLKQRDGEGEEYVDAYVFYKSFVDDSETSG
ncbi:hypothetical protein H0H93_015346 [Arthromyces matolae]|nr:hypothetical protein H0H93_015346 [Arthromyces matolae]